MLVLNRPKLKQQVSHGLPPGPILIRGPGGDHAAHDDARAVQGPQAHPSRRHRQVHALCKEAGRLAARGWVSCFVLYVEVPVTVSIKSHVLTQPHTHAGDRSGLVAAGTATTASASALGGNEKMVAARMREQLQRAAKEDLAHVNTCALFLLKVGNMP